MTRWYYQIFHEDFGPVDESQIHELTREGTLGADDMVRREDSSDWITVNEFQASNGDLSDPGEIGDLSELSFSFEEASAAPVAHSVNDTEAETETVTGPQHFVQSLGQILGPVDIEEIAEMLKSGTIDGSDEVKIGDDGEWQPLISLPELAAVLLDMTEHLPSADPEYSREDRLKSRAAAAAAYAAAEAASPENHAAPEGAAAGSPIETDTAANMDSPTDSKAGTRKAQKSATGSKSRAASANARQAKTKKVEDKVLNEIFDEVFAEESKPSRATGSALGASAFTRAATAESTSGSTAESEASPASQPSSAPVAEFASPSPMSPPGPRSIPSPKPKPSPSRSSSGGSGLGGMIKPIAIGGGALAVLAAIWFLIMPMLSGNTSTYLKRISATMAEYDALGPAPTEDAWKAYALKTRDEFTTYYKEMLDSGASGPRNDECREALKSVVALSALQFADREQRMKLATEVKLNLSKLARRK
jgi:hypothetical protein